jgi:hypothetical protein
MLGPFPFGNFGGVHETTAHDLKLYIHWFSPFTRGSLYFRDAQVIPGKISAMIQNLLSVGWLAI